MHKEIKSQLQTGGGPIPRTKNVLFNGNTIRVYSLGWLCYLTYLAKVTLRLWERKGILPKPFFKLAGGVRYYTSAELLAYSRIIREHYQSGRDLAELQQKLEQAYVLIRKKYLQSSGTKLNLIDTTLLDEEKYVKAFRKRKFTSKVSEELDRIQTSVDK